MSYKSMLHLLKKIAMQMKTLASASYRAHLLKNCFLMRQFCEIFAFSLHLSTSSYNC